MKAGYRRSVAPIGEDFGRPVTGQANPGIFTRQLNRAN